MIRNARENRGSSQGEKKERKVMLQEHKMQDKREAVFVVKGVEFFVISKQQSTRGRRVPLSQPEIYSSWTHFSPFCPPQIAWKKSEEPLNVKCWFSLLWLLFFHHLSTVKNFPCWSAAMGEVRSQKELEQSKGRESRSHLKQSQPKTRATLFPLVQLPPLIGNCSPFHCFEGERKLLQWIAHIVNTAG